MTGRLPEGQQAPLEHCCYTERRKVQRLENAVHMRCVWNAFTCMSLMAYVHESVKPGKGRSETEICD